MDGAHIWHPVVNKSAKTIKCYDTVIDTDADTAFRIAVFAGAWLVCLSGILVVFSESHRHRRSNNFASSVMVNFQTVLMISMSQMVMSSRVRTTFQDESSCN